MPTVNPPTTEVLGKVGQDFSKQRLALAIAALLILATVVLLERLPLRRSLFNQGRSKSIAILPFHPLGAQSQSEDEYLGIGLADAIITKLGEVRKLQVRPIEEVSRYSATGIDLDPVKAGRELAVGALLEGTIQRQAQRVRIKARLVDKASGTALWSDEIDSSIEDMFVIEDR